MQERNVIPPCQEDKDLGSQLAVPLLDLLLHVTPVPTAVADAEGRLLRGNPALEQQLARPATDLYEWHWTEVLDALGGDRTRGNELAEELARGQCDQVSLELHRAEANGATRWALLLLSALREKGGGVQGLLLQVLEEPIPALAANPKPRRANPDLGPVPRERRPIATSDRWQIATESADIGVYDLHIPTGRIVYSESYLRNLGYEPGSWRPTLGEWHCRLHPEDAPQVLAANITQRGSERMELEYRLRHRDGSWRWMLDRGRVVEWDEQDRPKRAVGALLDVTERRRAQTELERANERMRLAARADGIGFWEYDLVADRPHWDDEMLRIYGISREEFNATGEAWEAFLHPEDQGEEERSLRQSWEASDGVLEQRFRIIRPDGEVRHIRSSALLTRDGAGRPLRVIGVNFDFTDKRRAEEAAMAAHHREQRMVVHQRRVLQQKLKTSLTAAAIAHEINQPLSIILLHCQMAMARLEQSTGDTPWQHTVRPLLGTLIEEAERMHTTIETMRMLLRNVQTELRPVDLSNVTSSALLYLLPKLRQLEVERIGLTRPCLIEGDEAQLQICVSNVLRNALQATQAQPGGPRQIRVELRRHDHWVDLAVGDSGPGFGERRPDTTVLRSSKKEGTGLGLYVVRTTLDNHGGTIEFGRSPLGGAEVVLRFPLLG